MDLTRHSVLCGCRWVPALSLTRCVNSRFSSERFAMCRRGSARQRFHHRVFSNTFWSRHLKWCRYGGWDPVSLSMRPVAHRSDRDASTFPHFFVFASDTRISSLLSAMTKQFHLALFICSFNKSASLPSRQDTKKVSAKPGRRKLTCLLWCCSKPILSTDEFNTTCQSHQNT